MLRSRMLLVSAIAMAALCIFLVSDADDSDAITPCEGDIGNLHYQMNDTGCL